MEFDKSTDNKPKRMPMAAVFPKGIGVPVSRLGVISLKSNGSVSPSLEKIQQRAVNYLANLKRTPQTKKLCVPVSTRFYNLEK